MEKSSETGVLFIIRKICRSTTGISTVLLGCQPGVFLEHF